MDGEIHLPEEDEPIEAAMPSYLQGWQPPAPAVDEALEEETDEEHEADTLELMQDERYQKMGEGVMENILTAAVHPEQAPERLPPELLDFVQSDEGPIPLDEASKPKAKAKPNRSRENLHIMI